MRFKDFSHNENLFNPVRVLAKKLGVDLIVRFIGRRIYLGWIEVKNGEKGAGAAVIKALCAIADEAQLPIQLDVKDGEEGLISYYERFGFKLTGTYDGGDPEMERLPR